MFRTDQICYNASRASHLHKIFILCPRKRFIGSNNSGQIGTYRKRGLVGIRALFFHLDVFVDAGSDDLLRQVSEHRSDPLVHERKLSVRCVPEIVSTDGEPLSLKLLKTVSCHQRLEVFQNRTIVGLAKIERNIKTT